MSEWQPIETAPKDGAPVRLKCASYAPDHVFRWGDKRWETKIYAIARAVDAWWNEDCEQPTHWAPA